MGSMRVGKVLVTGGCGFVGSRIVQHLRQHHPECRITVLDARVTHTIVEEQPGVEYLQADITSIVDVQSVFTKSKDPFEVVIHCASLSPPLSERYARRMDELVHRVNVEGTRNVIRASREAGVQALVYTSSITVVTDDFSQSYANIDERWPLVEKGKASSYGESKAEAETLVLQANTATFRTCALRLAVVFGEGDTQFLPQIISCIVNKDESPYRLGDGTNLWDTVYVGNVADAHVLAVENLVSDHPTAAGEAFFIQNNEPVSSRDLMLQTWKTYNGHLPPFEIGIPLQVAWFVGFASEIWTWMTGRSSAITRGSVTDATAIRYTNGDKATRTLAYVPKVGLEEGLLRSCQWLSAQSNKG